MARVPDPDPRPDTGEVPAELAAPLTAYARGAGGLAQVLVVLQHARLLVPMVEVPAGTFADHDHDHGHGDRDVDMDGDGDGHAHGGPQMAAVSLQRPDGRRGLLAFTGREPLGRWNAEARPLPMSAREAAETALGDGASALVVDVAGPVQVVVEGEDLAALGRGWTLGRVGDQHAWVPPSV